MAVVGGTVEHEVARAAPARSGRGGWWVALVGAVVGGLLAVLMRGALYDDAMITLSFARNLVADGCWCLVPGQVVNTATSPLNVWLLAAPMLVGVPAMGAVALVTAAGFAAIAGWLRALAGPVAAVLAVVLLAGAPVVSQAVGMESLLGVAALVAIARYASVGRWAPAAPGVAAAILARPDLAVAAVAAVAVLAAAARVWRGPLAALAGGAVLTLPWWAVSWWALGSVWPDTLPVKAGMGGWGPDRSIHFVDALPYLDTLWPVETRLSAAALVLGVVAAVWAATRRRWVSAALVVGGLVDLAVLFATATNPATYYAAPAVGLCLCAVAMTAPLVRPVGVGAGVLAVASLVWLAVSTPSIVAGFHPWRLNGATSAQYAAIAAELPRNEVVLADEIGALAYFCRDHGCRVVDPYLADPGRVAERVDQWRAQRPWSAPNYAHHETPPPTQADHRLAAVYPADGGPGWPVTGVSHLPGVMRLEPVRR